MIRMTVDGGDLSEIEKSLGNLRRRAPYVMARAANRTATHVKKVTSEEVRKKYVIGVRATQGIMKVYRATGEKPTARVYIHGTHLNLKKFDVRKSTRKGRIVYQRARVEQNNSPVPLSARPRPFLAKMANGYHGLFVRKTDEPRSEIRGVAGPSVPQMIGSREVMYHIHESAQEMLQKRIEHEIDYLLSK